MLSQFKKYDLNRLKFFLGLCALIALVFSDAALATAGVTISSIATRIGSAVTSTTHVLQDVATITGVGFIIAAFFKLHQHKLNPTQVPMSQGITLLLIGAGLSVFPSLLNVVTTGVFGLSAAKIGSGISAINPA